ncbi:VTT domain-containing protein [Halomonas sp. MCCC 1A11058]|uniref:VTT domain-containing protein n=2 Tax=Oceanospirillales TaxID=135619 RepID=A0ABS9AZ59_9GAMM|nr:VTT domain-containing protein [Halomonas aerodenitrificans]MCE8040318.1 VTT domain-containing protein [Halomonas sp. MCCC 1A11062]
MAAYVWFWHSPDLTAVRHWVEQTSHHPLVVIGVMLTMAVTLAVGLPGSIGLWLIAPFYPPHIATPMLILGSVSGALGAYYLAARVGKRWNPEGLTRKIMEMLTKRGDLLTQCALRVLPGFPHSVINYAAGLCRLPLSTFVMAAALGLGIKWAVYASAIHSGLQAVSRGDDFISLDLVLPLIALALLLLIGAWMRRRVEENKEI